MKLSGSILWVNNFLCAVLIGCFILISCSNEGPKKDNAALYKSAIEKVLIEDSVTTNNLDAYPESKRPGVVVDRMESIDISRCPTDFQLAYMNHIRAWNRLALYAESKDARSIGILANTIDKGSKEGFWAGVETLVMGVSEDDKLVKEINDNVKTTWWDVKEAAIRYGAQIL